MVDGLVVATVFACLGVGLLLHHGWTHSYDEPSSHAKTESSVWVCYFQLADVVHLETWIVVIFANALCITLVFLLPLSIGGVMSALVACAILCAVGLVLGFQWFILYFFHPDVPLGMHNIANHETWIVTCLTICASMVGLELSN